MNTSITKTRPPSGRKKMKPETKVWPDLQGLKPLAAIVRPSGEEPAHQLIGVI
jgi:hypothetical protein